MQLLDIDGPFLTLSVLAEVFPQGLDAEDPERVAQARALFDAWQSAPSDASLESCARSVLEVVLEYEGLVTSPAPDEFEASLPGRSTRLRSSLAVREDDQPPVLLVTLHPDAPDLGRTVVDDAGSASPVERLRTLLQANDLLLGLATNERQWALVHSPRGGTTSVAIWETELWFDERLTFRAFTSLLGVRRTIGAADNETLPALFERSSHDEREVTNQLGYQVRRSIELLVHAFDRADDEASGELFRWIEPRTLYEAAVTVAMRLIFLLAAEARGLLPDDEAWIEAYAVTPLRDQLEETKVAGGEELLERRFDAWPRLLATFRAVHGGVEHDRLRLPGYGGGLFDPTRFSFLEGVDDRALRIPNRTILNILDSLQTLEVDVTGGRERRPLSYSALGVEQIGHTYERLLDHTAVRADAPAVGLIGKKGDEPEIALAELEREGGGRLVEHLVELTGKTSKAIEKALDSKADDARAARLHAACRGDAELIARVTPLLGVVRDDDFGMPMVFRAGGLFVTQSAGRRSSGTHYTPPSLTEPIVRYALEPVVYRGPADGVAEQDWELKSPSELLGLKVADIAMGSGAFLVAACRYLAARLVEAWERTPAERPDDHFADPGEQLRTASRLVAERCLYGVDKDPLAVEIAKVSLWLETMRKDRPFTFVDHSLRSGDSLLGLTSLQQLEALTLEPERATSVFLEPARAGIRATLDDVRAVREEIESSDALDLRDAEAKAAALAVADRRLRSLRVIGDLVVGAALEEVADKTNAMVTVESTVPEIQLALGAGDIDRRDALLAHVEARAADALMAGRASAAPDPPRPFHWALEFPEVFRRENYGFDAIIGNPPFLGGKRISTELGRAFEAFLTAQVGQRGAADLSAYFLRRARALMGKRSSAGLIATDRVSQGDTRRISLTALIEGGSCIHRAEPSREWPGEASTRFATVHFVSGEWRGQKVLAGEVVDWINSSLRAERDEKEPCVLHQPVLASTGTSVYGEGFVIDDPSAARRIAGESEMTAIKPYLIASDLTATPNQAPRRLIIDLSNCATYEDARRYPALLAHLERTVKPMRDSLKGQIHQDSFWKFWDLRPELYEALATLKTTIVCPRVARFISFARVPSSYIFGDRVVVITHEGCDLLAILQSILHELWIDRFRTTMGAAPTYVVKTCFRTFPIPEESTWTSLETIGARYEAVRANAMATNGIGLTEFYGLFHDSSHSDDDVMTARTLQVEMDRAVAAVYGWSDLELAREFRKTASGVRYTVSDPVRTEALDRLLELNHTRHADEVAGSLHEGKDSGKKPRRRDTDESQRLFVND
jgi:hypothetical protein